MELLSESAPFFIDNNAVSSMIVFKIDINEKVETLANNNSTKKRIRQNERRRLRNANDKSRMRTTSKKLIKLISVKGEKDTEEIKKLHNNFARILDKNAQKNVIHWKKAARLKSRMAQKVSSALSS